MGFAHGGHTLTIAGEGMSDLGKGTRPPTTRLRYHAPEIERIGSIAEITAASSTYNPAGADNAHGYAESSNSPS